MESKGEKRSSDTSSSGEPRGKKMKKEVKKEAVSRKLNLLKTKSMAKCLSKYKVVYLRDGEEDAMVVRDVFSDTVDYRFGFKGRANAEVLINGVLSLLQKLEKPGEFVDKAMFDEIKALKLEPLDAENFQIMLSEDSEAEVVQIKHFLDEEKKNAIIMSLVKFEKSTPQLRLTNYHLGNFRGSVYMYDLEAINLLRYIVEKFDIEKYQTLFVNDADLVGDNFF